MRRNALTIALCTLLLAGTSYAGPDKANVATGTGVGQRLPQFTAQTIDISGAKPQTAELDSHQTKKPTVYLFAGTRCPATAAYAERLTQLEKTYGAKGVDFIDVYPNREDTREAKLAFHAEKKRTARVIDDQGGRIARLLGARRTTELVLVDKDGVIVYRGAVDDSRDPGAVQQHYLANALDAVLAGKAVTTATTNVSA